MGIEYVSVNVETERANLCGR